MGTAELIASLRSRGETVATAESLTGGGVCAELTSVPGSSTVVAGGVIAYATRVKAELLGVDPALLERRGPVDADVAGEMATGVRRALGTTWGVATTGVAGPGPADGKEAGTVFVAVAGEMAGESVVRVRALDLTGGDRHQIRDRSVTAALALLAETTDRGGPTS